LFVSLGAWPVFGFFGLDVGLIYFAFRRNYADARVAEEIELSPLRLTLTRLDARGAPQRLEFNPAWARFSVLRDHEGDVLAMALVSHGVSHPIGRFLGPEDARSFAEAFNRALAACRHRPAITAA